MGTSAVYSAASSIALGSSSVSPTSKNTGRGGRGGREVMRTYGTFLADVTPGGSMAADTSLAAQKLAEALRALGVEPQGENLADTPARVAELWADLFSGLDAKN